MSLARPRRDPRHFAHSGSKRPLNHRQSRWWAGNFRVQVGRQHIGRRKRTQMGFLLRSIVRRISVRFKLRHRSRQSHNRVGFGGARRGLNRSAVDSEASTRDVVHVTVRPSTAYPGISVEISEIGSEATYVVVTLLANSVAERFFTLVSQTSLAGREAPSVACSFHDSIILSQSMEFPARPGRFTDATASGSAPSVLAVSPTGVAAKPLVLVIRLNTIAP